MGWSGGDWVCDRPNTEFVPVSSVCDQLRGHIPPQFMIWPEISSGDDFRYLGLDYKKRAVDCNPVDVFGGVRYDIGLVSSGEKTICTSLLEIKRYWDIGYVDLIKLSRTLFYLGKDPQSSEGVALENIFVGAFVWYRDGQGERLEDQFKKIDRQVNAWWEAATTGGGRPIQEAFRAKYGLVPKPKVSRGSSRCGTGEKSNSEYAAVCVSLTLDPAPG
jgi:hypothetical protein